jgi:outer membrane protein TolC
LDSLQTQTLQHNAELLTLEALVLSRGLEEELAAKQGWPNLALGVDWIHVGRRDDVTLADNGKDALMATVSLELPLWRGAVGAAKREAASRHDAATERLADLRAQLLSRLETGVFRHRDAQRKISLYRDSLIPKANQSLQAAQAAFESGDGDFLSVLDAERALLQFTLSLERARADLVIAQADMDVLTGEHGGDQ